MGMPYEFGGWSAGDAGVPPVYDPGGMTWLVQGRGSPEDLDALLAAAREAGVVQLVAPNVEPGGLDGTGFAVMSTFFGGSVHEPGAAGVSEATLDDVGFLLDLAEARREAYEKVQPVFWRQAVDARDHQEMWFRQLVRVPGPRVLRHAEGFLIANLDERGWLVDDFVVRTADAWTSAGRALLTSLPGDIVVVCAVHDEPKTALMRALGLEPVCQWYQRTV